MKKRKWEPVIINIMADGSRVDDLTKYVIPSGHAYYDIIIGFRKEKLRKGGLTMRYAIHNQERKRKLHIYQ